MTDSEILKLNLKGRVISEKRLIEIFGTPTIMNNYKENGHFIRNDKYRLMDKAKRFCNIVEKENNISECENRINVLEGDISNLQVQADLKLDEVKNIVGDLKELIANA